MLAIGDGANDVAMIQAADVGIGIAGKEGRQAVNNSDYAIPQFRFITRLLLVHGQLSRYRLGRLIKYSFYKNSTFAGVLFYFQIYNGFSGQTLVDDISAAVYNVIFTSLPILFFSLLDRPCQFSTLLNYPRTYNKSLGLSIPIFWKTGVLHVRSCSRAACCPGASSRTDAAAHTRRRMCRPSLMRPSASSSPFSQPRPRGSAPSSMSSPLARPSTSACWAS